MKAGEHYEQREEGKMVWRWNQVAGKMNSPEMEERERWVGSEKGKKKMKDIEGQRGGRGLDNCLSFR